MVARIKNDLRKECEKLGEAIWNIYFLFIIHINIDKENIFRDYMSVCYPYPYDIW